MAGQRRYYNYGNTAIDPDGAYAHLHKSNNDAKKEHRIKTRNTAKPLPKKSGVFSTLLLIVCVFAMFSFIIARYSVICATSGDIDDLKSQIKTLEKEADGYTLQISESMDMKTIQEIAANELRMGFPAAEQIKYVRFQDDTVVADEGNDQNQVSNDNKKNINVLAEIVNALD